MDVLGKVGCNGCDQECSDAHPVQDEFRMHTDVGCDLAIPITGALEFVETIFECILVVGTLNFVQISNTIRPRNELTPRNDSE
jgi:hypothetical protein